MRIGVYGSRDRGGKGDAEKMTTELIWFVLGMSFGLGFILSFAAGYVFARRTE